ncbi:unnamed protein product [Nesidiocoris tenuis]|uniref:Uncharacterized protein n=1 Tax=Nesidiocoris tenuis TaxID=355587 RepID=A0A6H5G6J7_9HEMI|nr:unnamed protein product [Nesidiocoris tenuis]CAA9998464.1 unnamed protein product [Nesidiocoris tenuis]
MKFQRRCSTHRHLLGVWCAVPVAWWPMERVHLLLQDWQNAGQVKYESGITSSCETIVPLNRSLRACNILRQCITTFLPSAVIGDDHR